MAEIKATDVKNLREKTGAGMMECKKALTEADGDMAAAEKLLKEKGLAGVEKRADRATSEGRVFIAVGDARVALVEIACETDFVAKNEDFIKIGNDICEKALKENISSVTESLSGMLVDLATKIRENMTIKRVKILDVPAGSVCAKYIHSDGKTGAAVVIKADGVASTEDVKTFAYDCCLHLAAFTPQFVKREDVDKAYLDEQTEIFTAQVAALDKPDNVKKGIIQGKINKHLADICFVDQMFVKDDKMSVAKKMEEIGKKAGGKLSFVHTFLFSLGQKD